MQELFAGFLNFKLEHLIMFAIAGILIYLAIAK